MGGVRKSRLHHQLRPTRVLRSFQLRLSAFDSGQSIKLNVSDCVHIDFKVSLLFLNFGSVICANRLCCIESLFII